MATLDIVRSYWQGKTNSSPRAKIIKTLLETKGHSDVHVWWEPFGAAMEMCGNSGGFMCVTKELAAIEPLGLSFNEAVDHIKTVPWLDLSLGVKTP